MRLYLFIFIFTCATGVSIAQQLHAVYEYIPSSAATFMEHVYFNNGQKVAVRDSIKVGASDADAAEDHGGMTASLSLMLQDGPQFRHIVLQQPDAKQVLETRTLKGVNHLIMDDFPGLNWNTDYTDVDSIAPYVCRKATATYRGTTLVAYYTEDVPVPVGPDKFGGLPGLIVMLYNEGANPNYWLLKAVNFPFDGQIPIDQGYMQSLPKLSLQQYVQQDEALMEEQMRIMESKMPVMQGVNSERKRIRGTVEQRYEWEQGGLNAH